MTDHLFDLNNPNASIFLVPTEQGGSEDDIGYGSIGDATAKHVSSLTNADRQLWESLYVAGSGAIFRTLPNTSWHDPDPFNLKGKDLEYFIEDYVNDHYPSGTVPEKDMVALLEALEAEKERRTISEDVYDQDVTLIPYDEWEAHPGLMSHVDIPSTPRDIMLFMGNCSQAFYDYFPEGHVDADLINAFLMRLNQPSEKLTTKYLKHISKWLKSEKCNKDYVRKYLLLTLKHINEDADPEDTIIWALTKIDQSWSTEHKNAVAKSLKNDKIYNYMQFKYQEWRRLAKANNQVFSQVKLLGAILYRDFKNEMQNYHWAFYNRMKHEFAPRAILSGIDINQCNLQTLKKITGSEQKAVNMFHARPFASIYEAYNQGFITSKTFATSPEMELLLNRIDQFADKAKKQKDMSVFAPLVKALIAGQANGILVLNGQKLQLSPDQWQGVWNYYRLVRSTDSKELQ
jgi:hypothetical protein